MKIEKLVLKGVYKIEWLRCISGVDLSNHCMKSFLGRNMKGFKGYKRKYENIEIPKGYPFYYFCAVDENFIWANNVHIAFREKEGSEIRINDRFVECVIKDAERIEITNKYIDRRLPQSRDRYFYTCRNWQFANMIRDKFPKQKLLFDE